VNQKAFFKENLKRRETIFKLWSKPYRKSLCYLGDLMQDATMHRGAAVEQGNIFDLLKINDRF